MKAVFGDETIAQSDDIVEARGYSYFPASAVRLELMEKSPRTAADLDCPHGVQFYDVVAEGKRHERAAWSYERPQPKMHAVGGRFGFWGDVKLI